MSNSKWKRMGLDYSRDVMICPKCKGIFVHRYKRACPSCKIPLLYPGERFCPDNDGYIYRKGKGWIKISKVETIQ